MTVLKAEKKKISVSDFVHHDSFRRFYLRCRRRILRQLPYFVTLCADYLRSLPAGRQGSGHLADHLAGVPVCACHVPPGLLCRKYPCSSGDRRSSFCHPPCLYSSQFSIVNGRPQINQHACHYLLRSYAGAQREEELPFHTRGNEIIHMHAIISRNK